MRSMRIAHESEPAAFQRATSASSVGGSGGKPTLASYERPTAYTSPCGPTATLLTKSSWLAGPSHVSDHATVAFCAAATEARRTAIDGARERTYVMGDPSVHAERCF